MIVTGEQFRAARAMARIEQADLARQANVSVETIKRLERTEGPVSANVQTVDAVVRALEAAGIEFTNGDAPGVRMPKDRTYGFVHDDQRLVGLVKNGEFRSDSDGSLIAVVKDGNLHDPQTGEWLAALDQLRVTGNLLPNRLKDKLK